MIKSLRKKYVGDKAFYKMVLGISMPIIVQTAITNFVSLLDNIMVGQVGTEQMSGVSIANQLMFVYLLCIFGGHGGAGIFTAQFHGKGDQEGIRYTMRFKMLVSIVLTTVAVCILTWYDDPLINQFLHDGSATGDLALTLTSGKAYMKVMLIGLIPFAVSQVYTSTLREVGETLMPMKAGIAAVFVNLFFNWVLIYGNLGAPGLGVVGAAVATVISRFVECGIVIIWTHRHERRFPFMHGVWKSLRVPLTLTRDMIIRGTPLMVNEGLWSLSMTIISQCYSTRGLAVVAGINIANTIINLFNVVYMSLGTAVGIVVGKLLGQGSEEEAIDTDRKMITFCIFTGLTIGYVMAIIAPLFPGLYNTTQEVRDLATYFIRVMGMLMPLHAFIHSCYFTMRCGGKTGVTFLFDCGYSCGVCVPAALLLAYRTDLSIIGLYLICQIVDVMKMVIGMFLLKKGTWVHNIVGGGAEKTEISTTQDSMSE